MGSVDVAGCKARTSGSSLEVSGQASSKPPENFCRRDCKGVEPYGKPGVPLGPGVGGRNTSAVGGVGTCWEASAARKGGVSMPERSPPNGVTDPSKGVVSRSCDCPTSHVYSEVPRGYSTGAGEGVGLTLSSARGSGEGVGLAGARGAGEGVSAGCTTM